jgi:uncharacterized protein
VLPGGYVSALLRETANRVKEMALSKTLVEKLAAQMLFQMGNSPSPAERRSWENSLVEISELFIQCGLGDVNLLVEYQLPYSSKRIDVIALGSSPKNETPTVIAIELKQWSNASLIEGALDSLKIDSYGNTPILHPAVQVSRYCEYLSDFNRYVSHENTNLFGIAYLHNWMDTNNSALDLIQPTSHGMLFTGNQKNKLKEFLTARISPKFSDQVTDDFLNSRIAPTKQLMQLAAEEVKNREQFRLLDEQQIAYSMVMKALRDAETSNTKTAVIITGGPGTGKSVIALSLLGELSRRGKTTLHATGSKAFRNSLRKIAGARSPQVQKLFSYFNSFMSAERNSLDVIICDEAHRIRETSANRYTKADLRTGTPQLHELLNVARVPVFLLDSNQVVRKGETGTPDYIEEEARELGLKVIRVDLDGQFRCGGSRLYETWLNGFLNLDHSEKVTWTKDPNFKVLVAGSPEEIESKLRQFESEGYKSRITAGYCWTWNDPNEDGSLPNDVKIGNWSKPWNVKGDRGIGGYLSGELWAIDPKGFDQIGCVYTAQGFEYDWNAVIFGPDLVWRSGTWVADRSGSKDPAMRGIAPDHFETLVKNTYKVLLTRGLVGTLIYSVDEETQQYFVSLFN